MAFNKLTPDQWKQAGQAKTPQEWTAGLPGTVGAQVERDRVAAETERDEAPVNIAKQLTANTPINPNQDISGQMVGIQSQAYGAARGAREALGTRANALRSMLNMTPYNVTGEDNSANTVREISQATQEQAAISHPNAIAKQRAKLLQQGGF